MFRAVVIAVIIAVAIDYFAFDGRYTADAKYYVQKMGRDINGEVTRFLDRGR